MRPYAWMHTPAGPSAASQLGQLGAWRRDPHPARTEIDDQDGVLLDADDPAEAVLIVCHLVAHGELLGRRSEGRDAEGTCWTEGAGRGGGAGDRRGPVTSPPVCPPTPSGSPGPPVGAAPPDEPRGPARP